MSPEEFGLACARELETAIEQLGEDRIAAFIAEPVQGAGGVIVAPDTYWPEVQRICDEHDILLIADEVICGFGRTGQWFGCQTLNIRPDIITIAKGLSSGYQPIGASVVHNRVAQVINATEFNHGYTYSGHPVASAVALENLRILEEENIVDHVRQVASPALHTVMDRFADHPMIGETKLVGLMGSLAMTPDKSKRAAFKAPAGTVGYICRERCFANNLVMRHVGDRMIISPPLVITPDEIELLAQRAGKALDETYEEVKRQGLWEAAE